MRKNIFLISIFTLLLILIPYALVDSHGLGTSIEVIEGDYLADIGYDAFLIEAQTPVRFDFGLFSSTEELWQPNNDGTYTSNSALPVDFDNLWVRVEETESNNRTIFATGIQQPTFGPTTMLFSFLKEGAYTMYIRFQNAKDEKIVEVKLPITVEKSSAGNSSFSIGWSLFLALFIGIAVGIFVPNPFKKE
ncbi:MAG: hypothetical protein HYT93_00830 [Parcubacteria group bacterium]|nr:hypothetical protein [Parcubacteria group bacterium]